MKRELTISQLAELARTNTLVFIGATAAGKDTVMNRVAAISGAKKLLSLTTRPKRPGEIDGEQYYFVNDREFGSIKMVESRTYKTAGADKVWKYGLPTPIGAKQGVLILDWQGYCDFKSWRLENGFEAPVSVFVDIDEQTAEKRQQSRGDYNPDEFKRRWESDLEWVELAREKAEWSVSGQK